jgi:hypothetical protein
MAWLLNRVEVRKLSVMLFCSFVVSSGGFDLVGKQAKMVPMARDIYSGPPLPTRCVPGDSFEPGRVITSWSLVSFIVTTMGIKPSPSGETFRFFS